MATIRGFDFPDGLFYLMEHDTRARLDDDGLATAFATNRNRLIPEMTGVAAFIGRVLDPEWSTLVF